MSDTHSVQDQSVDPYAGLTPLNEDKTVLLQLEPVTHDAQKEDPEVSLCVVPLAADEEITIQGIIAAGYTIRDLYSLVKRVDHSYFDRLGTKADFDPRNLAQYTIRCLISRIRNSNIKTRDMVFQHLRQWLADINSPLLPEVTVPTSPVITFVDASSPRSSAQSFGNYTDYLYPKYLDDIVKQAKDFTLVKWASSVIFVFMMIILLGFVFLSGPFFILLLFTLALIAIGNFIYRTLALLPMQIVETTVDYTTTPIAYSLYWMKCKVVDKESAPTYADFKKTFTLKYKVLVALVCLLCLALLALAWRYVFGQTVVKKENREKDKEPNRRKHDKTSFTAKSEIVKTVVTGGLFVLVPAFLALYGLTRGTSLYSSLHRLASGVTDFAQLVDWLNLTTKASTEITVSETVERDASETGNLYLFDKTKHTMKQNLILLDKIQGTETYVAYAQESDAILIGKFDIVLRDNDFYEYSFGTGQLARCAYLNFQIATVIVKKAIEQNMVKPEEAIKVSKAIRVDRGPYADLFVKPSRSSRTSSRTSSVQSSLASPREVEEFVSPKWAIEKGPVDQTYIRKDFVLGVQTQDFDSFSSIVWPEDATSYIDYIKFLAKIQFPVIDHSDSFYGRNSFFDDSFYVDLNILFQENLAKHEAKKLVQSVKTTAPEINKEGLWSDAAEDLRNSFNEIKFEKIQQIFNNVRDHLKENWYLYALAATIATVVGVALYRKKPTVDDYLKAKRAGTSTLEIEKNMSAADIYKAALLYRDEVALSKRKFADVPLNVQKDQEKKKKGSGKKKAKLRNFKKMTDISSFTPSERRDWVAHNYKFDDSSKENIAHMLEHAKEFLDDKVKDYMLDYDDWNNNNDDDDDHTPDTSSDEEEVFYTNGGDVDLVTSKPKSGKNLINFQPRSGKFWYNESKMEAALVTDSSSADSWPAIKLTELAKELKISLGVTKGGQFVFVGKNFSQEEIRKYRTKRLYLRIPEHPPTIVSWNFQYDILTKTYPEQQDASKELFAPPIIAPTIDKMPKTETTIQFLGKDVSVSKEFWNNSENIIKQLKSVLYIISKDGKDLMHGLRLGSYLVFPNHLLNGALSEDIFEYRMAGGVPATFRASQVHRATGSAYDLAFVPAVWTTASSRIGFHIPDEGTFDAFIIGYAVGKDKIDENTFTIYRTTVVQGSLENHPALFYQVESEPGSCGSLILTCDTRTICGFHVERREELANNNLVVTKVGQPIDSKYFKALPVPNFRS